MRKEKKKNDTNNQHYEFRCKCGGIMSEIIEARKSFSPLLGDMKKNYEK